MVVSQNLTDMEGLLLEQCVVDDEAMKATEFYKSFTVVTGITCPNKVIFESHPSGHQSP